MVQTINRNRQRLKKEKKLKLRKEGSTVVAVVVELPSFILRLLILLVEKTVYIYVVMLFDFNSILFSIASNR